MVNRKKLETLAYNLNNLKSLRNLFSELNFDFVDEPVNKENWNDLEKQIVLDSKIIAKHEDYLIYYIQTNTDTLTQWKSVSTKLIKQNHGLCLVVLHNPSGFKWVFSSLSKEFSKSFTETRHIPIEIRPNMGVPKNFVDFIEKIEVSEDSTATSISSQMSDAFDTFAVELHNELTINVFEALKTLSEGIIRDKSNQLSLNNETLEEIREPIFILLYRIIFILYAEDRGIFPIDNKIYHEKFSIKWLKKQWLLEPSNTEQLKNYEVQRRLKNLFRLIEIGSEELDYSPKELRMRSYYGRIFDRKINHRLENWNIPNSNLLKTLSFLTRSRDKKGNYFFLDYSALNTRHLGSIYEHLLEFHLHVKDKKIEDLPNEAERKSTGSYYTPKHIVDYIIKNSVEPLIQSIIEKNTNKQTQIEKILSLKILDPAMGSGHFLVGVVEYLAKRICEIEFSEISEQEYIERKRDVVRRCIYGVDLNPLAVDLASLSLWLETLSSEKPLSFLMAHLKCGNSLIGNEIESIFEKQITLFESEKGYSKFKKNVQKFLMFENLEDDSPTAVKMKLEEYSKMQSSGTIYYDLKFLLNCKTAEFFGIKIPNLGDYRAKIGENSMDFYLDPLYQEVKKLSDHERFFHWGLEFPQVFYDENGLKKENSGFDVIIGNPPYVSFGLGRVGKLDEKKERYIRSAFPSSAEYKISTYALFMELAVRLSHSSGFQGFILPDSFLIGRYFSKVRSLILEQGLVRLVRFDEDFWESGDVGFPVIWIGRKAHKTSDFIATFVRSLDDLEAGDYSDRKLSISQPLSNRRKRIRLFHDEQISDIVSTLEQTDKILADYLSMHHGIRSKVGRERIISKSPPAGDTRWKKGLVASNQVTRFHLQYRNDYTLVDPDLLFSGGWDKEKIEVPKILIRRTSDSVIACFDENDYYHTNAIIYGNLNDTKDFHTLRFLVGVLNSRLFTYYYRVVTMKGGRTFPQVEIDSLEELYVPDLSYSIPTTESQIGTHFKAYLERGQRKEACIEINMANPKILLEYLMLLVLKMESLQKSLKSTQESFLDWLKVATGSDFGDWVDKNAIFDLYVNTLESLLDAFRKNEEKSLLKPISKSADLLILKEHFESMKRQTKPLIRLAQTVNDLIDFVVYRLYGLTVEQIAVVEDASTTTIRERYHIAKKILTHKKK